MDCEHVDHADVNASFNIGKPVLYCVRGQFNVERDTLNGSTDTPKGATLGTIETLNLNNRFLQKPSLNIGRFEEGNYRKVGTPHSLEVGGCQNDTKSYDQCYDAYNARFQLLL